MVLSKPVKVKFKMTETALTISGKEPIRSSELDPKFKYELIKMHGSEKILKCFQCGTCTFDSPVARYETYGNPILHYPQLLGLAMGHSTRRISLQRTPSQDIKNTKTSN